MAQIEQVNEDPWYNHANAARVLFPRELTSLTAVAGDALIPSTKIVGRKDDSGKVRMELMASLSRAYEGVAKVLTWAVTKKKPIPYEPGSWQGVDDFYNRYLGALKRHLVNIERNGPYARDHETELLDLYHLATDAMFLAEMATRDIEHANDLGYKRITTAFAVPSTTPAES